MFRDVLTKSQFLHQKERKTQQPAVVFRAVRRNNFVQKYNSLRYILVRGRQSTDLSRARARGIY